MDNCLSGAIGAHETLEDLPAVDPCTIRMAGLMVNGVHSMRRHTFIRSNRPRREKRIANKGRGTSPENLDQFFIGVVWHIPLRVFCLK